MGCPTKCNFGDNLVFSVVTHDPVTGVLTDADSDPTYKIYMDETGKFVGSGTMTKLDDANTTGFYTESILCNDLNQMEDGRTYTVYIETVVGGDVGSSTYGFKISGTPIGFIRRANYIPVGWA